MSQTKKGVDLLRDKSLNQSIDFTRKEREELGLRGLLPHRAASKKHLVERVMTNLARLPRDIDRYMLLSGLQERNERIFYRTVKYETLKGKLVDVPYLIARTVTMLDGPHK